jgi:hypothetical protein
LLQIVRLAILDVFYAKLTMPLPSVLKHGAKLCSAKSKRTGLPCNNPAAFSCRSCRMHGAHKSRNVAHGVNSGKYTKGHYTKEAKEKSIKRLVRLRYLEDLGQQGGFMKGARTRGRKPAGYIKLDLSKAENLVIAIETINKE